MVNKANPCSHPACIFVGKTAGCSDLRLDLPKLHLTTLILLSLWICTPSSWISYLPYWLLVNCLVMKVVVSTEAIHYDGLQFCDLNANQVSFECQECLHHGSSQTWGEIVFWTKTSCTRAPNWKGRVILICYSELQVRPAWNGNRNTR